MDYRQMTAPDLALALDWAAEEGWNPGLDDAAAFLAADPQGYFVADAGAGPVAAISVVNHDAEVAFLGLYLCRPDWRGRGIGLALWHHALKHAGARSVGLDGVPAQQANYARSGFVASGATIRLEGRLDGRPDPQVRDLVAGDLPALAALDRVANGHARPAFLAAWTAATPTRRTLVLDRAGVQGFATIRRCRRGAKIGPVVAPDADAALRLIHAALDRLPATPAVIDLPQSNAALLAALGAAGLVETFRTARMFRGPAPTSDPCLQAVGTLELG